jgi:hypothetical protein
MRHRLMTLALTGTLALVSQTTPLKAQDSCAAQPDALILRQSIPLADAMPEQSGAGPWPRIFHQKTVALTYEPRQQLLLAGVSPNGSPPRLRTDDLARIDVFPSGLHWEHDFRDVARTRIDPLTEKPDLSGLFVAGDNQLTLTLTDLLGPSWSTSNYTLEVWEPCQQPPVAAAPVESYDAAVAAVPVTDTAAATIIDLVPAEVITALMTAERGAALPTDEAIAALLAAVPTAASEAPTAMPTATPMPTATAGAVALAKVEALQTPLPVPATLQEALPAAASPVAAAVTENVTAPALPAPAPSGGRLWRLFFALALLVGGWCYYRYGGQWRDLLAQMQGLADELIPVARQHLLTLWHRYAEEHYYKLVKVVVENKASKRR